MPGVTDGFLLGNVRLDLERGVVLGQDGVQVTLRPKSAELLRLLLARHGRLVSRSDILDAIWPDVHVTDDSITQCVVELRRALGAEAGRLKTLPKRGYVLELPEGGGLAAAASGVPAPSGTPIVAVMPFRVAPNDPALGALAEGVLDGVVGALATLREPVVISVNSTLPMAGAVLSPGEVGRRLCAQYVASGSLRRLGDVLRLGVELAEAASAAVLWRRAYDLPAGLSPEVEDEVAAVIAHTLVPRVQEAELRRSRRQAPADWSAYQLLLEARQMIFRMEHAPFEAAGELLRRAIAMDPGFAGGHAALANWCSLRLGQGWSPDRGEDARLLADSAKQAALLDSDASRAVALLAHNETLATRNYDAALKLFDRALSSAPNDAETLMWSVPTFAYLGDAREAVRRGERAIRLSPEDPLLFRYEHFLSIAHYAAGDMAAAAEWGLRSLSSNARYTSNLRTTAAALVALGREREARRLGRMVLDIEPHFRVGAVVSRYAASRPETREVYGRQLLAAGLPA